MMTSTTEELILVVRNTRRKLQTQKFIMAAAVTTMIILVVVVLQQQQHNFHPFVHSFSLMPNHVPHQQQQQQHQTQQQQQQQRRRRTNVFRSSLHTTASTWTDDSNSNNYGPIEFLGKGTDAIVRLGVVLVAPLNEFHHFYRQAAIYIYAMGYDNNDDNQAENDQTNLSSTYYIRGVILDHPTPFTVQEMIPNFASWSSSLSSFNQPQHDHHHHPLASNLIFRGGDKGRENSVLLLHNQKNVPKCSEEIGTSGLYHGGFDYIASTASSSSRSSSSSSAIGSSDKDIDMDGHNFKFFFNYCEFTEDEIEELFASSEDGDAWASVQIHDTSLILNEEWDRGDCWRYIRNSIAQQQQQQERK